MIYCIYHKNCTDGFASAYSFKKSFNPSSAIVYIAWGHGDPLCGFRKEDILYFCDISPKKEKYLRLKEQVHDIFVLEHHKTAYNELHDIMDSEHFIYDDTNCASIVVWNHFQKYIKIPEMFKYIRLRDLEKDTTSEELPYIYYIYSLPFDFKVWENAINTFETSAYNEGLSILRHCISSGSITLKTIHTLNLDGHLVPAINSKDNMAYLWKEIMHRFPSAEFVVMYSIRNDNKISVSLRSMSYDVETIAKSYSRGGHPFSSAFNISLSRFNPSFFKKLWYRFAGIKYIEVNDVNEYTLRS